MADDAVDSTAAAAAETNAAKTARWRAQKAANDQAIIDAYNKKRIEQNLPPVSLQMTHEYSFRGQKRPNYDPPPEQKAIMTDEQLKEWRATARKKRKADKQRENNRKRKELVEDIKRKLSEMKDSPIEGVKQAEEANKSKLDLKSSNSRPAFNPPPEEMAKMSKADLSAWRAKQRKIRKVEKQRERRLEEKLERAVKEGKMTPEEMKAYKDNDQSGVVLPQLGQPEFNPPPEEMAKMSKKDLSAWRAEQRKKRKARKQREKRLEQKLLLICATKSGQTTQEDTKTDKDDQKQVPYAGISLSTPDEIASALSDARNLLAFKYTRVVSPASEGFAECTPSKGVCKTSG